MSNCDAEYAHIMSYQQDCGQFTPVTPLRQCQDSNRGLPRESRQNCAPLAHMPSERQQCQINNEATEGRAIAARQACVMAKPKGLSCIQDGYGDVQLDANGNIIAPQVPDVRRGGAYETGNIANTMCH